MNDKQLDFETIIVEGVGNIKKTELFDKSKHHLLDENSDVTMYSGTYKLINQDE